MNAAAARARHLLLGAVVDWGNLASGCDGSITLRLLCLPGELCESSRFQQLLTAAGLAETVNSVRILPGKGQRRSGSALLCVSDGAGAIAVAKFFHGRRWGSSVPVVVRVTSKVAKDECAAGGEKLECKRSQGPACGGFHLGLDWAEVASGREKRTTLQLLCLPCALCSQGALASVLAKAGLASAVEDVRIIPGDGSGKRLGSAILRVVDPSNVVKVARHFHGRQWGRSAPVAVRFAAEQVGVADTQKPKSYCTASDTQKAKSCCTARAGLEASPRRPGVKRLYDSKHHSPLELNWADLASGRDKRCILQLRCLPRKLCSADALRQTLASAGLAEVVVATRVLPPTSTTGTALVKAADGTGVAAVARYFHGRRWGAAMPVQVRFAAVQDDALLDGARPLGSSRDSVDSSVPSASCADLLCGREQRFTLRLGHLPHQLCDLHTFHLVLDMAGLAGVVDSVRILPACKERGEEGIVEDTPNGGTRAGSALINAIDSAGVHAVSKYFHGRCWGQSTPVTVEFASMQAGVTGPQCRGTETEIEFETEAESEDDFAQSHALDLNWADLASGLEKRTTLDLQGLPSCLCDSGAFHDALTAGGLAGDVDFVHIVPGSEGAGRALVHCATVTGAAALANHFHDRRWGDSQPVMVRYAAVQRVDEVVRWAFRPAAIESKAMAGGLSW